MALVFITSFKAKIQIKYYNLLSFYLDINSYWKEVLTNMSKQVKNDNSYGQIKVTSLCGTRNQ